MKIAGLSLAYNEQDLITGCIKSLEGFVDRHLIMVSEKPYFGDPEPMDNTVEIAEDLGAEVITGVWELDHHQRNTGIALLQDYDWIICTDADMWFERESMFRLVDRLMAIKEDAAIIAQKSYWKTHEYRIEGDDFLPVIAVKPNRKFLHIGCIGRPFHVIKDIHVHHLAWCAPKDIYKKVITYPHAPEFDGKKWYKENYENWEGDYADLPNKRFKIAKDPLPYELQAYLPNR